jgi:hypothetical protein
MVLVSTAKRDGLSHTGNIYKHVLYKERNDGNYILD